MVKYVLADILRVRKLRLDAAEKAFKQAKDAVAQAEHALAAEKQALAEYKVYIIKATDEAYQKVMRQMIKRGAVDDLHYELQKLKQGLQEHELKVEQAEVNLEKTQKELEEKRKELDIANKNIEKLNSHKEIWMAEAQKEAERAEDKELEEFTGKSRKK